MTQTFFQLPVYADGKMKNWLNLLAEHDLSNARSAAKSKLLRVTHFARPMPVAMAQGAEASLLSVKILP